MTKGCIYIEGKPGLLRSRNYLGGQYTVYALTFAVFADQQPSANVLPRENLHKAMYISRA